MALKRVSEYINSPNHINLQKDTLGLIGLRMTKNWRNYRNVAINMDINVFLR
jgi:hypothetical protein